MKKRFTRIMAALALLVFMAPSMVAWGQTTVASFSRSGTENTITGGTFSTTFSAKSGYYQDNNGDCYMQILNTSAYWTSVPTSISFDATIGGGTGNHSLTNPVYVSLLDANGDVISGTQTAVTSFITTNTGDSYTISISVVNNVYGVKLSHEKESGYNVRYYSFSLSFIGDGGTPTPTTYTVTYDCNGGTSGCPENVSGIEPGTTITLADGPEKENYLFAGWNDGENTYDEGDEYEVNGNVAFTAQWDADPNAPQYEWVLTDLANLSSSDVFVIVGNNGSNFAMANDGGTASAPSAVAVTVANNKVTSAVADNIKWNISGDATDGYVFYPNGNNAKWLYCTNDNNGVRVGTNTNTTFKVVSNYLQHQGTSRYVGVYNSTDWRCYTSINQNIQGQTIAFYKRQVVSTDPAIYASNVNIAYNDLQGQIEYTLENEVTDGELTATTTSDWLTLPQTFASPITFTATKNTVTEPRTAAVTLNYVKNGEVLATKDVMVTQGAHPATYTTIEALFNAAGSTATEVFVTFGGWVVSGVSTNGYNVFVNDGTTGFVINGGDHGFEVGNTLTSTTPIACTLQKSNGYAKVTGVNASTEDLTVGTGGTVTVADIAMADLAGINTGALVHYENLTCSVSTNSSGTTTYYHLSDGTTSIQVYNALFAFEALEDGHTYNITGVYQQYNNTKEILPRSADDIEEVALQSFELEIEADNGTVAVYIGEDLQSGTDGSYQIPQGSVVTLTHTPAEGYRFKEWVAEAEEGTVTITNNQFTMPACYVLIQAVFEAIPTWVYTYSINGIEGDINEAEDGESLTLAAGTNLNADFTFTGWTTDPNDVTNILAAGSSYIVLSNIEFYAVYAHTTGEVSTSKENASYVKVTSDLGTNWAGDYLIAYSDYIFANGRIGGKNEGAIGYANTSIDLSDEITDNTIPALVGDTYNVTLEEISEGSNTYVLKTKDGKYNYQTSNANGIAASDNKETAASYPISITFNSQDDIALALGGNASGAVFHFNPGNTGNTDTFFRYYKNGGQEPVYLYKKQTSGTPTPQPTTAYYTRVFLNETPNANIAIVGPSIIPSGYMLSMESNNMQLTNNLGVNSLIIEDGAQYFGNSVEATVQKNIEACTYSNDNSEGYYLIASPIFDELNATDINGLLTDQYDLYKYDNQEDLEWRNYKTNQFSIDPEVGYLYASGSNTTIEFAGELNEMLTTGMYDVTVPNAGFNLIGNPLPYNVALVNEDFEAVDYMVLNTNGGGFENSSEAIAPCNAILIQTTTDGETVYFVDPSIMYDVKAFNINLSENNKQIDNVRVRFGEGRGMNKFYLNENSSRIYFQQGNEEKAVTYSNAQADMPVSFKAAENGTYTLSFNAENTEMSYMHLIDNMTGADIDLLQTPSYSFEANTTDYANRFRIVFHANNSVNEMSEDHFAFFNGSEWVVSNEGEATLQVIDMMGRVLSSQTVNGNANVKVSEAKGVYVIRLTSGNSTKTQKVVVK